ncbi:NAD-dependent epimerase/dehydratase family protein [Candidatus Kaiserbacteria bacterium]|nr:MAG: NAD-dependent epimerase/dehydratase family protein [Candidatus Kaiserbacteria bacterium]
MYGPHFDPDGAYALVIGKFLKLRSEGLSMTITGDGEQSRDFTHVRDMIDAVIRASQNPDVGKVKYLMSVRVAMPLLMKLQKLLAVLLNMSLHVSSQNTHFPTLLKSVRLSAGYLPFHSKRELQNSKRSLD